MMLCFIKNTFLNNDILKQVILTSLVFYEIKKSSFKEMVHTFKKKNLFIF